MGEKEEEIQQQEVVGISSSKEERGTRGARRPYGRAREVRWWDGGAVVQMEWWMLLMVWRGGEDVDGRRWWKLCGG